MQGTNTGTITDLDGKFSIDTPPKALLEFSFIGYKTITMEVTGKELHITMQEDSKQLDEVVVVGYGSQKKVNVTGSVSMVNADVLESRPVQNVSQALQGVIPGLNMSVGSSGGTLDGKLNVNIRGAGTISDGSSSSPLVLIDGIEGDMNTVNPNDIESVSVLKDAASSSIYGARAAFGVILITTKSGKSGKTRVNYSGNVRFSDAIQLPDMVDSYTFAQYFNRLRPMVENLLPLMKKHCKISWTSKTENLPTLLLPNIMEWRPDRTANGKAMQDLLPIQTGSKSSIRAGRLLRNTT